MPDFPFPSCLFFCLGAAALRPSLCWRGGSTRRPRGRSFRRTLPEEVHKFRVHFVGMRPIYGVRPIFYGGQAGARDQLGGLFARGFDRYDAVGVAVNDQSGYVYTRDVLAEVLMPCGDAGEARRGRGTGGYVPTGFDDLFADALAEEDIRVEEVLKERSEEHTSELQSRGHLVCRLLLE